MMLNKRLIGLAAEVPWHVALAIILALAAIACAAGGGLVLAQLLGRVFEGQDLSSVASLLVLAGALLAGRAAFIWARELAGLWTASIIKRRLRRRLYARLLELGPGYMQANRSGQVQSTLVDGVEALQGYVAFYLPQVVVAIVAPAAIILYLLTIDAVVASVVAIGAILVPAARPFLQRVLSLKGQSLWDAFSRLYARFLDAFQGMTTLKAFNAVESHGESVRAEAVNLYHLTLQNLLVSSVVYILVSIGFGVGTAVAISAGALRFTELGLTATELLIIMFLAVECFRPQLELQNYWHEGFYGVAASRDVFDMLDAPALLTDAGQAGLPLDSRRAPRIAFESVTFTYPGSDSPALRGIELHVEPGETVAVVGPSGAGKTSLVSLLLRFFDPDQGRITVNGTDLRDVSLDSCRSLSAVVSQDVYLFHDTVAANLRLAKPDATDDELIEASRAANAHDFIEALDRGYDTVVGDRGVLLSGGQRQRLAIARALLKDAPLLILDEATSSVDGENETAIQEALRQVTEGRTTLIVAHRLSTVEHAHRVFVLEEGRLVESGTREELLSRRGLYARLSEVAGVAGARTSAPAAPSSNQGLV